MRKVLFFLFCMIISSLVFSQSDKELKMLAFKHGAGIMTDDFDGSKTLYFDRTPIPLFIKKSNDSISLIWRLGYATNKVTEGMESVLILAGGKTFDIRFNKNELKRTSVSRYKQAGITAITGMKEEIPVSSRYSDYAEYVDYDISNNEEIINAITESKFINIRFTHKSGTIDEEHGRADIKGMKSIIYLYKDLSKH